MQYGHTNTKTFYCRCTVDFRHGIQKFAKFYKRKCMKFSQCCVDKIFIKNRSTVDIYL